MFNAYENRATEAQAYEALRLAQIEAERTTKPMKSSAEACAKDAAAFFDQGRFGFCHEWAVESLKYSVGILSPAYAKALEGVKREKA